MHWTDCSLTINAMIADACEEWLSLLTADALKPHDNCYAAFQGNSY